MSREKLTVQFSVFRPQCIESLVSIDSFSTCLLITSYPKSKHVSKSIAQSNYRLHQIKPWDNLILESKIFDSKHKFDFSSEWAEIVADVLGIIVSQFFNNFAMFAGKHLCWSLFFNKVAGFGLQNFANSFFHGTTLVAAFDNWNKNWRIKNVDQKMVMLKERIHYGNISFRTFHEIHFKDISLKINHFHFQDLSLNKR